MCLYLPLQAVHGAAASDGVGARVRGSHRAQTQLLCGQRWCSAGCQTAAAWSGLWAPPAPVWLRASVCSPRGCRACVHSQPLHLHIQKHQQAHTCKVTCKEMIKEKKKSIFPHTLTLLVLVLENKACQVFRENVVHCKTLQTVSLYCEPLSVLCPSERMTASVPRGNWMLPLLRQSSCRTWASVCSAADAQTWWSRLSTC